MTRTCENWSHCSEENAFKKCQPQWDFPNPAHIKCWTCFARIKNGFNSLHASSPSWELRAKPGAWQGLKIGCQKAPPDTRQKPSAWLDTSCTSSQGQHSLDGLQHSQLVIFASSCWPEFYVGGARLKHWTTRKSFHNRYSLKSFN